jgi:hypothetical protein
VAACTRRLPRVRVFAGHITMDNALKKTTKYPLPVVSSQWILGFVVFGLIFGALSVFDLDYN